MAHGAEIPVNLALSPSLNGLRLALRALRFGESETSACTSAFEPAGGNRMATKTRVRVDPKDRKRKRKRGKGKSIKKSV